MSDSVIVRRDTTGGGPNMALSRRTVLKATGVAASSLLAAATMRVQSPRAQGAAETLPDSIKTLLDPALKAELLRIEDVGRSTYYVVAQFDDDGTGEPIFIREPESGEAVIIEDVRALPLELILGGGGEAAPGADQVDLDILAFSLPENDLQVFEPDSEAAAAESLDKALLKTAQESLGMSSREAPGTNRGRLACAWAVNRVCEKALRRQLGGGLATANMIKVLRARHVQVNRGGAPAGCVVISPTVYSGNRANIGHVGIVGENNTIYSNSSSRARWEQNFTVDSWTQYYRGKGLGVYFYRLDADYF
ncbi:hypothetical protein CN120_23435 [Sinorhizobium meliloti]|uniref:CHAP domain-containing protein n=1 Tax=Rhizobium meliloti TaxID=382 RepID=UPI000FDA59AC|nr:CHAP domain-containing protein [Sinorhizobium meliloti]RVN00444.1 hypothetical protein CN120_23435 [Sinorhizobium meliloti]